MKLVCKINYKRDCKIYESKKVKLATKSNVLICQRFAKHVEVISGFY